MRRTFLCLTLCAAAALRAEDAPIAVKAARLLDVKSGAYVANPVVVVRGDKIESVGTKVPAGATVLDLGDGASSGLIDAHTCPSPGRRDKPSTLPDLQVPVAPSARAVRALKIARELFYGPADLETEGPVRRRRLRDAVNEGVIPGPRMKVVDGALARRQYPPRTSGRLGLPRRVQGLLRRHGFRKASASTLLRDDVVKIYGTRAD